MATKTEIVKEVLKIISDEFDVEFQDMFNYVRLYMSLSDSQECKPKTNVCCESGKGHKSRCHAYVKKTEGVVEQCSRQQSHGCFCAMHSRHHKEGRLKHGYIKAEKKSESNKSIRKLEKISLTSGQLFCDSMTGKIYYSPDDGTEEVTAVSI